MVRMPREHHKEPLCHTQKSELDPVGDRITEGSELYFIYQLEIRWSKGRKERLKAVSQLGGYSSDTNKK